MAATKFFINPFAVSGDKMAIPNPIQVSGSVSYSEGFGFDYQRDLLSDAAALAVPRQQSNQLYYDITSALQQYQTTGVPNFISTSDNGGTPYSYAKFAMAWYDDGTNGPRTYQSLVNANVALPTDATKWRLVDGFGQSLTLNNAVFEGTVIDGDAVYWNAGATQFTKAIANGTGAQEMVGFADVTNKRVYTSGVVPVLSGLTAGSVYYLSSVTAGAITTIEPVGNVVRVGIAQTTTNLILTISQTDSFEGVYAQNGYMIYPNGVIDQWGYSGGNIPANSGINVTLPIAFPTAIFSLNVTWYTLSAIGGSSQCIMGGGPLGGIGSSLTQLALVNNTPTSSASCFYRVIGN